MWLRAWVLICMVEWVVRTKPRPLTPITTLSKYLQQQIKGTGASGWRAPFFLLLLFIAGCMALLYRWYEKLRKSHIL